MTYLYSLRIALDPGRTEERGLADLATFIEAARVDDVMVFANVEEMNTGHTDDAEREVYRGLSQRVAAVAAEAGASMSLNPWHTLMHGDYGKGLRPGQDFQLMVDPNGRSASLAVCPRDRNWRRYIAGLYGFYAAAHPRFIWVEDDFRYHNHWPLEWGGCFCDEHLAEFSRRAGHEVTRAEFVAGVVQPGEPHPFRRIWFDTARQALEETAAAIQKAVHEVAPRTRIGLMTSLPQVHASEGRNWAPLLSALCGKQPPAVRIHLPAYAERRPAEYLAAFHAISDAHRALLPPEAEIYPELENFPYSRFSKSLAFTRFQLLGAQVLAPDGMTIDLFDLNGNGLVLEEAYQDVLAGTRDYLDRGLASGVFRRARAGVAVLVSEESGAALHTAEGRSMDELYPREYVFGALFGGYGVPFRYTTDIEVSGEVVAVSGQLFRTLGAERTQRLFELNRLIIDAEAAATVVELGLGHLVAAREVTWVGPNSGAATYEEAVDEVHLLGRSHARASVLMLGADIGLVDYDGDGRVRPLTSLMKPGSEGVAAGHVLVDDRVLVTPFGRIDPLEPPPVMLRTTLRQQLLQQVVERWTSELVLLRDAADVAVYVYPHDNGLSVYLVNASLDTLVRPRLRVGRAVATVHADPSAGEPGPVDFITDGTDVILDLRLPSLEAVLLDLVQHEGIGR